MRDLCYAHGIGTLARLGENLRTPCIRGEEGPSVRDEQEGRGLLQHMRKSNERQEPAATRNIEARYGGEPETHNFLPQS
jgi:hypothetical protein